MLAKSPILTIASYLLMLVGFGLILAGIMPEPNQANWTVLLLRMVFGMLMMLVSVSLFFYLLAKDRQIRMQEKD